MRAISRKVNSLRSVKEIQQERERLNKELWCAWRYENICGFQKAIPAAGVKFAKHPWKDFGEKPRLDKILTAHRVCLYLSMFRYEETAIHGKGWYLSGYIHYKQTKRPQGVAKHVWGWHEISAIGDYAMSKSEAGQWADQLLEAKLIHAKKRLTRDLKKLDAKARALH